MQGFDVVPKGLVVHIWDVQTDLPLKIDFTASA